MRDNGGQPDVEPALEYVLFFVGDGESVNDPAHRVIGIIRLRWLREQSTHQHGHKRQHGRPLFTYGMPEPPCTVSGEQDRRRAGAQGKGGS